MQVSAVAAALAYAASYALPAIYVGGYVQAAVSGGEWSLSPSLPSSPLYPMIHVGMWISLLLLILGQPLKPQRAIPLAALLVVPMLLATFLPGGMFSDAMTPVLGLCSGYWVWFGAVTFTAFALLGSAHWAAAEADQAGSGIP